MDKIKINIWKLSVDDKVRWAAAITEAISRDDSLPHARDLVESVDAATAGLQAVYQEAVALRKELLEKATRLVEMEDQWNRVMTEAVQRLRGEVKDEAEKKVVAGFYLHTSSRPGLVADLAVCAGDGVGTLNIIFDPVRGADVYEVQSGVSPNLQSWNFKAVSHSSKVTLSGLPSGCRCWVRVRAVGSTGIGPWSESVSKIVP